MTRADEERMRAWRAEVRELVRIHGRAIVLEHVRVAEADLAALEADRAAREERIRRWRDVIQGVQPDAYWNPRRFAIEMRADVARIGEALDRALASDDGTGNRGDRFDYGEASTMFEEFTTNSEVLRYWAGEISFQEMAPS